MDTNFLAKLLCVACQILLWVWGEKEWGRVAVMTPLLFISMLIVEVQK